LVEGTKIAIREDRGQWLLVERADGQQGWVRKEAAELVGVN
jgi:SH3-like domain-containing protein